MTDKTLKYLIHNKNPEPLTVIVELWAEEFVLSPGSSLLLTILYDKEGLLEVEMTPDYYVVWLWGGCRVKLSLNGEDLNMPWLLTPFP
jgi:hypothetical protein